MIICYSRSSSLKEIEMCEQKYFINYNLGLVEPPNKKAVMGTISHKVLEWLALARLNFNNRSFNKYLNEEKIIFYDDSLKEDIEICPHRLMEVTTLEDSTVKEINKTRANKSIYLDPCLLSGTVERIGYNLVNELVIKAFNYYSSKYKYDWTVSDLKNCGNWVWMALEWKDGHYDPRNRNILSPERQFDISIEQDWAKYDFTLGNERISGNFAIKGTIDLITSVDSDTIEVVDWKTGQRKDWSTGEEKTYEDLCSDIQLALYHYAVTRLYPTYKHVLLTIFFIRNGGPFTVTFDSDNIGSVEERLREHFEFIKNNKLPKMRSSTQSDFQCKKFCSYYKNNWPGTEQNVCRFINNEIKRIGIDEVILNYKQNSFSFNQYQSPGE